MYSGRSTKLMPSSSPSKTKMGGGSARRRGLVTSRRYSYGKGKAGSGIKKQLGATFSATPRVVLAAFEANHMAGTTAVDAATQRGNIKVVVRVRPPNSREIGPSRRLVVQAVDSNLVVFDPKEDSLAGFFFHGVKQKSRDFLKKPNKDLKFVFDNVYGPTHSNLQIFEGTIKPTIDTLLAGYNCSVFAYGATGSGKTYTMLGISEDNPGLTFLTVMELYNRLMELQHEYESEVTISYLEVYNETIKDLLSTSGPLNVCEDGSGVIIPKLTKHKPKDALQILDILRHGNRERSQHPTDHNSESSRSHAVFQVFVTLRGRYKDLNNNVKAAKLVMVDLAGSERGSATGCQGARFREGASINKSLLALGNCINALADGKKHIPYRDSKLTRILKDALGGNCKTVMIANVSPSDISYDDTYNTLSYADRAKRIKFHVKKNLMTVHARVAQYGAVVSEMAREIQHFKDRVEELENCKCRNPKINASTSTHDDAPDFPRSSPASNCTYVNLNHDSTIVLGPRGNLESPLRKINSSAYDQHQSPSYSSTSCDATKLESHRRFARLLEEKTQLEERQQVIITTLRDLDWKQKWKEIRLKAAKELDSKVGCNIKGMERMKKLFETSESQKNELKIKLRIIRASIEDCDEKLTDAENTFCGVNFYPASSHEPMMMSISRSDYAQFKRIQAEKSTQSNFVSNVQKSFDQIFEELMKTEGLLDRSLQELKPTHLLMKHFGHATKDNEQAFTNLITEFYCSRIQFAPGAGDHDDTTKVLSPYCDNNIANLHNGNGNGQSSTTSHSSMSYNYNEQDVISSTSAE